MRHHNACVELTSRGGPRLYKGARKQQRQHRNVTTTSPPSLPPNTAQIPPRSSQSLGGRSDDELDVEGKRYRIMIESKFKIGITRDGRSPSSIWRRLTGEDSWSRGNVRCLFKQLAKEGLKFSSQPPTLSLGIKNILIRLDSGPPLPREEDNIT